MKSFAAISGATVNLGADTASDTVAFDQTKMPTGEVQMRVHNAGTDTVFVDFGASTVTAAAASDIPVPGGAVEVLTLISSDASPITHAAAITASGTSTVYFTPGHGI